jgi:hypothetical protein
MSEVFAMPQRRAAAVNCPMVGGDRLFTRPRWKPDIRSRGYPDAGRTTEPNRKEEVMKADALMRFILSGNRSLEEFAVLLARISVGVFFAISGANKLFVASQYKLKTYSCASGDSNML